MLQFSDTTNKNGIIQRFEDDANLADAYISGNATRLAQQTAIANSVYARANFLIMTARDDWSWDDTSHTDQAVTTTSIVSDQGDYTFLVNTPDSTKDYLRPTRVEIKDSAGNWVRLVKKDLRRHTGSISESRTNTGTPTSFDFNGTSIFLDAIPNYASTGGLKIWFDRAFLQFSTSDTTKRPGFASLFHEYIPLGMLYKWEKKNLPAKSEQTKRDMMEMEQAIQKHYSKRDKTEQPIIRRPARSYR